MTLVLLHPIGLDGLTWHFMPFPANRGRIGYTLPWHGDRGRPDGEVSLDAFADDVVRHVGGPLDLVGVSMGGAVAQSIAIRYPDRVRSLLLAASTAGGRRGGTHAQRAEEAERDGMAGVTASHLERWFSPAVLAAGTDPGLLYARDTLLRLDPASFAASWRALGQHDTLDRLPGILAPTTVLHPADDLAASVEPKEAMVAAIPRSRLVVAPGPHMIQLERPREFLAQVLAHLTWARTQAG